MAKDSIAERIASLKEPINDDRPFEIALLEQLPEDLPTPVISNIDKKEKGRVYAWLSFGGTSYEMNNGEYNAAEILPALEAAGFEPLPATLVKRDNYRPSPEPGLIEDIPDTKPSRWGKYELTDSWPMMPLWVKPCQHTHPDAVAFYKMPSGHIVRVSIDIPRHFCFVTARRINIKGDWYFERGSSRYQCKKSWEFLEAEDGQHAAAIHFKSGAQVDTEQSISAHIYWEPLTDPVKMTPANMLTQLLAEDNA